MSNAEMEIELDDTEVQDNSYDRDEEFYPQEDGGLDETPLSKK